MSAVDRSRLPAVGADPRFMFPEIVRHTLPNGLAVRTVEHPGVPVVTLLLQVRGGSGADPAGREGLAGVAADMADEGTGELGAIEVSDALARIGADWDVDVTGDATVFSLTTLVQFAGRGASLLSDLVLRPSLRQADFDRVRQLRLDRLRQLGDVPAAVAERAFLGLLYGAHPYGHLAAGTDESLRRVQLEDVTVFHARTCRPLQTTLVVCGALSHRELAGLAEEAFGGWPTAEGATPPEDPAAVEPAPDRQVRLALVHRQQAQQSELRIGQVAASRTTPDYAALVVMNAILGGQFTSRLNLKLREEKGYTYGARTYFTWHRGRSPFSLQTSVQTEATSDAIVCALDEFDAIRGRRPPSDEEMALAKASLTRGYPRGFETAEQVAHAVGQLALYELPDGYFSEFAPRVNAVTAEEVVRAAARHIDPARLTTLVVGDETAVAESLGRLGLGDPLMVSPG